ncbi:hypothetical protein BDQ17DRAFT_1311813 [Cyathus striatus]|nr:hypothetical protein BDQ17DRAFT_1311813 [Cyathus striatus]
MGSVKSKLSSSKGSESQTSNSGSNEPTYSIQPHPAKTNDPADLQPSGGLRNQGGMEAFHARDPYVPSKEIRDNLPEPLSREELQARTAALNNDQQ